LKHTAMLDHPHRKPNIIALEPATYVAQVFQPFRAELHRAIVGDAAVHADVATAEGLRLATRQRALFRGIRTALEAHRREFKAPLLEAGRQLDEAARHLTADIEPFEQRHDEAIKAEEARRHARRQARDAEQAAITAGILAQIESIRRLALIATTAEPAAITALISEAEAFAPSAEAHATLVSEAERARSETLATLQTLLTQARNREQHRREQHRQAATQRALEQERVSAERSQLQADLAVERAEPDRPRPVADREDADRQAVAEARARRQWADHSRVHSIAPQLLAICRDLAALNTPQTPALPAAVIELIDRARGALRQLDAD